MSTEEAYRKTRFGTFDRLALALVDILTGEVAAEVVKVNRNDGTHFMLKVKKAGIQDD